MPIVNADDIKITFECPDCGPTSVVLSNGYADNSVASCGTGGHEFGAWTDIRRQAHRETAQFWQSAVGGS